MGTAEGELGRVACLWTSHAVWTGLGPHPSKCPKSSPECAPAPAFSKWLPRPPAWLRPAGERTSPRALEPFAWSFGEVVLDPRGMVGSEPMDMAEKSKNGGVDRRGLMPYRCQRAWVASPSV